MHSARKAHHTAITGNHLAAGRHLPDTAYWAMAAFSILCDGLLNMKQNIRKIFYMLHFKNILDVVACKIRRKTFLQKLSHTQLILLLQDRLKAAETRTISMTVQ